MMSSDQERRVAFSRLQPICSRLLQDRTNAGSVVQYLGALRDALNETSNKGLKGCSDYILFPLMLLVDSVVVSRVSSGVLCCHRAV